MAAGGEHKKKRKPEKRGAEDGSKLRKPAKKARKEATDTLSAPAELRTSLLVEADDPDFPREIDRQRSIEEEKGKKKKRKKRRRRRRRRRGEVPRVVLAATLPGGCLRAVAAREFFSPRAGSRNVSPRGREFEA
ncbi:hypothetical protein B296_00058542, partial [Ensete ventricosum]